MSAEATKTAGDTKPKPAIIRCQGIGRTFWRGKERLDVLEGLDLEIPER